MLDYCIIKILKSQKEVRFMQQSFLLAVKYWMVSLGTVILLLLIYPMPVMAEEARNEKVEAISDLMFEINYFYFHPNAADFMSSFYTRESYDSLRWAFNRAQEIKIPNWENELDDAALTELYQLLRAAVTNLQPLTILRGEAIAQNQDLNFRVLPETGTQVFHTLSYGTPFEILDEVQGGVVVGDDLSRNYNWFRIRHNDQPGYVHSKYVRTLPVSGERSGLLADIARQELWIQSKIDGWQTDYSPDTRRALREVLNSARTMQVENWQFDLNYYELNQIFQSLSYEHLNLITHLRYSLINDIVRVKGEIENNIQGSGSARMENYTEDSWENMRASLMEAWALLDEEWEYNLSDEELESIHELLLLGLNGLESIPQHLQISEDENELVENNGADSGLNPRQILISALAVLVGVFLIIKIIKFIY